MAMFSFGHLLVLVFLAFVLFVWNSILHAPRKDGSTACAKRAPVPCHFPPRTNNSSTHDRHRRYSATGTSWAS